MISMQRCLITSALATVLTGMISACATPQAEQVPEEKHPSGTIRKVREAANDSWIYAQISSTVYGGQGDKFISPYVAEIDGAKNYWSGFKAKPYKLTLPDSEPILVVAYAGTENIQDWLFGNLDVFNTQYKQGLEFLREMKTLHSGLKKIIVTGHSLGGAISIYSASREPGIEAYVFNPSIRVHGGKYGTQDNINSVSQYAELLAVIRKALPNPNGTYSTLGCIDKSPGKRHAIRALAECLTHVAAWESKLALESLQENGLGDRKHIDSSTNTLVL
ncbi:lipase family protein [Pseudomonas putida]|uniref:lipase family protein n=1 Tax=Pseudomonas putida TaxID=303 RepID=UPI00236446D9|nr:hypothetical protein [Pseudomonas putida]MDD2145316.1 hypothetical protein [Pseudomonas putida]HDS1709457.1 DUF2974 domain-containing protein [Pseudomonas putida]